MSTEELQALLKFRCTGTDQDLLVKEVTEEENSKVLFSMPNDNSPCPYGFTSEFFKGAWSVIGKYFISAIKSFL